MGCGVETLTHMTSNKTDNSESELTAAYIRVSTQEQMENNSHIKQEEQLKHYCQERNWDNLIFYRDIAESGQKLDRDEYQDMMNNLENIDRLVVRELSRLGRDLMTILKDIEELDDKNVEFISIKEGFDTSSAMGEAMFKIVGVINELQANLARERTLEHIERQRQKGEHIGRPKKLSEQQIGQVMNWYAQGYSYKAITLLIEDKWDVDISTSTIQRYIKNREESVNGDDTNGT